MLVKDYERDTENRLKEEIIDLRVNNSILKSHIDNNLMMVTGESAYEIAKLKQQLAKKDEEIQMLRKKLELANDKSFEDKVMSRLVTENRALSVIDNALMQFCFEFLEVSDCEENRRNILHLIKTVGKKKIKRMRDNEKELTYVKSIYGKLAGLCLLQNNIPNNRRNRAKALGIMKSISLHKQPSDPYVRLSSKYGSLVKHVLSTYNLTYTKENREDIFKIIREHSIMRS